MKIRSISELVTESGITEYGWACLRDLASTVQRIHYPNNPDSEELVSLGIDKGVSLLLDDREEGNYRSIRSYLYTGMRNAMSNYLYRQAKDVGFDDRDGVVTIDETPLVLHRADIEKVVYGVGVEYEVYLPEVERCLRQLITGESVSYPSKVVERLSTLILWSYLENMGVV